MDIYAAETRIIENIIRENLSVCHDDYHIRVDFRKEIERLTKEEEKLLSEINRSHNMLGNEKFMSKAPEAKINEEKDKLAKYENMLKQVQDQLKVLRSK